MKHLIVGSVLLMAGAALAQEAPTAVTAAAIAPST